MSKWLGLWMSVVLIAIAAPASAGKLVVKKKKGSTHVVISLEPKSPHTGEEAQVVVRVETRAHVEGSKKHTQVPVTDATVEAHPGHAKSAETSVPLAHDDGEPGTYRGTLTFAHAGKETFHVGVTLPGKDEWMIRIHVKVKKKHAD